MHGFIYRFLNNIKLLLNYSNVRFIFCRYRTHYRQFASRNTINTNNRYIILGYTCIMSCQMRLNDRNEQNTKLF